jgi:hypothetical protein
MMTVAVSVIWFDLTADDQVTRADDDRRGDAPANPLDHGDGQDGARHPGDGEGRHALRHCLGPTTGPLASTQREVTVRSVRSRGHARSGARSYPLMDKTLQATITPPITQARMGWA